MGLENGDYINDLINTNPTSTDKRRFGDDHLRLIKKVLLNSFPTVDAPVLPSVTELNYVDGVTSAIQPQINAKIGPADIANSAEKDEQNVFTQGQATLELELTFNVNLVIDAATSNAFWVEATDDFTLGLPLNGILGQVLTLFIAQDNIGSRIITYDSAMRGSLNDDLVLSTGGSTLDLMTLIYGGPTARWFVAGLKKDMHGAI